MQMSKEAVRIGIAFMILITTTLQGYAQSIDNEFQLRTYADFSKKITKGLKMELAPELRWGGGEFLDKYLLNAQLSYKPLDFLSLSAQYRFIGNKRTEKDTEFLGRYQFSVKLADKFHRWEPGFRLAYTNFTDENEDGKFLKYRASLAYDIAKSKWTPKAGFQVYHDLDQSNIFKYRTQVGLDYKLTERLTLKGSYKFDYFMTKSKNRHILDIGLKVKL